MIAINWGEYKACPTCKAYEGERCMHPLFSTTKGKPVYLDAPHSKRKLVGISKVTCNEKIAHSVLANRNFKA